MSLVAPSIIHLNGVAVDCDDGSLVGRDGGRTRLRRQSLDVLRHLVASGGRVVSKDELLDTVWPGIAVTENSLSQCISEIRKAIGDEKQAVLKTVPRRGYRLALDDGEPAPALTGDATPARRLMGFAGGGVGLAGAALAVLAGLAAYSWWGGGESAVPASLSIAVLPFANLSEAADHAYLANGFTDDLTAELARVPGLFVVSRNAARVQAASGGEPAAIAARLGVRYLLEGSVRREGRQVRINANLVDATTSEQIWAERFDGAFAEMFALQDEVVGDIVGELELSLVPGKANLAVSGDTDDPEAYQAFRQGIEARRTDTVEGTVEALVHLRRALALDPGFGAAAAEMAWLYWDADEARRSALGLTWQEVDERLYAALDAAAVNPPPAYHQLRAELLVRERRAGEAAALLEEAVALDPSDPWTYEGLSQALVFGGRPGEARVHLDAALRVDPGWTDWRRYQAGIAAFGQERYDEAVDHLSRIDLSAPAPWPKFYGQHVLVASLGRLGRADEAAKALDALARLLGQRGDGAPNLLIAQQYLVYGEEADTQRLLDGLRRAGVPDVSADLEPEQGERIDGEAIAALVTGNRLSGTQIRPQTSPYAATIAADGSIVKTIGSETGGSETGGGNTGGGVTVEGRAWVQDDFLCAAYPRMLTTCAAVYRDTDPAAGQPGDYLLVSRSSTVAFSAAP